MLYKKLKIFLILSLSICFFVILSSAVVCLYAGWSIQTVDSAGDVGWATSLALDTNSNPHISYRDYTNQDLKYAKWNDSSWSIQTVDSAGNVGEYISLALDTNNNPYISYRDYTNQDLKYAKWNGSSWSIQTVDSAGNVGEYISLALDTNSNPHISYCDSANGDLKYAKWNGSSWSIQTVDSAGNVGWFTSLALDTNNNPHISYYDKTNQDLKYAKWNGSSWLIQTVDSAGNVGEYISLALDINSNPHISYYDVTNQDLKYAKWNSSSWSIQTVDSVGDVGWATSLALDTNSNPHISYRDYTNQDLKYAKWDGLSWLIQTVDSVGNVGWATSLALDINSNPHISYYDYTNQDLKYAKWMNAPNAPSSLLCEGQSNPTNVTDATPEFSWSFSDPDFGDTQGAYQILVATSSDCFNSGPYLWNSTKIRSSSNTASYAGISLSNNTTYYWKVKTWDKDDNEGEYSSEQNFFYIGVHWLSPSSLIFVQFSDTHIKPVEEDISREAQFQEAINETNNLFPDFVINTGDLVESPSDASYQNYINIIECLNVPHYTVMGNHDDDCAYEPYPPNCPSDYANLYKEYTGNSSTYYSFDWKGYHFIILDSVNPGAHSGTFSFPPEQLDWLETDLSKVGNENPVLLFCHHPPAGNRADVNDYNDLYNIIKDYNIKVFYSGHSHSTPLTEFIDNICFVNSNSLAFASSGKIGYRVNSINGDEMWTAWINLDASEPIINRNRIDETNSYYEDASGENVSATKIEEGDIVSRSVSFLPGTAKKAILEIRYAQEMKNEQSYTQQSSIDIITSDGYVKLGEFPDAPVWTNVLLPISESVMSKALSNGKITIVISNPSSQRNLWIDWIDLGESTVEWEQLYPRRDILSPPQHVHLSWDSDDTSSTTVITWATANNVESRVEFGLTPSYGLEKAGSSFWSSACNEYIHTVELTGLDSFTTYYYRCGSESSGWSKGHSFITGLPKGSAERFRFVAFSDTQTQDNIRKQIKDRAKDTNSSFCVLCGDLVENGYDQNQWNEWFNTMEDLISNCPLMPAIGNHHGNPTAPNYFDQFNLPNNEKYYSFNYGNAHFIVIEAPFEDSRVLPGSDQYNWLENDLQQAANDPEIVWKFAFWHVPPYSTGSSHDGNENLKNDLCPLLEQYGVNIAFFGHNHIYERTYMIANDSVTQTGPNFEGSEGVIHVITGGAGGALCDVGYDWFTAYSEKCHHFCLITIEDRELSLKAIRLDGTIIDEFTITLLDEVAPSAVTDLRGTSKIFPGEVELTWTAPGDDGIKNILNGEYRIQYSTLAIFEEGWSKDNCQIIWSTNSVIPGSYQNKVITGLNEGNTYYFRLWSSDEVPNWSGISNGTTIWVPVIESTPLIADKVMLISSRDWLLADEEDSIELEARVTDENNNIITTYAGVIKFEIYCGNLLRKEYEIEASSGIAKLIYKDNIGGIMRIKGKVEGLKEGEIEIVCWLDNNKGGEILCDKDDGKTKVLCRPDSFDNDRIKINIIVENDPEIIVSDVKEVEYIVGSTRKLEVISSSGDVHFQQKINIIMSYDDKDNNEFIDGTNIKEDKIKIFSYDEENQKWKMIDSYVNKDSNYAFADIENVLGIYCLMSAEIPGELNIIKITNYPNPFAEETRFIFDLGCPAEVTVKIYTIKARLIQEISHQGKTGYNEIFYDGKDKDNQELANGIYLYKIIAQNGNGEKIEKIGKMTKMK